MGNNPWFIKKILEPTIEIEELRFAAPQDEPEFSSPQFQESYGRIYPAISINGYLVKHNEITSMIIDQTGFLPSISLKLNFPNSAIFLTTSLPKDGDLISVYISGRDDIYTSIRCDFLITSIPPNNITNGGRHCTITINGILNVPGLDADRSIGKKGTSFNVLKEIAQELGLGFSTNETNTDDEQIWISPNQSIRKFISEITLHSWKNENSFFDSFIDIYYTLNFVNVNNQLSHDKELLTVLQESIHIDHITEGKRPSSPEHQEESKLIFSNDPDWEGGNFHFSKHSVINESSDISKKYGYIYNTAFYELNSNKDWDIPVEPLVSFDKPEDTWLLKGKANDNTYLKQTKKNWCGIQYTTDDHNVHPYYLYAKAFNILNLVELNKLNIKISLDKFNLNVQRYGRYPIRMVVMGDPVRANTINEEIETGEHITKEQKEMFAIDKLYTGFYMLKGLKIRFNQDFPGDKQLWEELVFTRREWPMPI